MIELIFVRHGQPDWEPGGRAVDEPQLSKLGKMQAERVAQALGRERIDRLYTSTMRRAVETGAPLAEQLDRAPVRLSWLRELGLPTLHGQTTAEVGAFFERARARELEQWWDGLEGGESFRHFHERVSAGIDGLLCQGHGARLHLDGAHRLWRPQPPAAGAAEDGPQRIVLVAHGGSISVAVTHLLGMEPVPWAHERTQLGWAGLVRLRMVPIAGAWIWSLDRWNERGHLAGLPDPAG
ncbi:MAG: histidine phosphatase family protein [Myxococcota bacterium]